MIAGNSKKVLALSLIVFGVLAFLGYGNYMKQSQINSLNRKVNDEDIFYKEIAHKYQDCLKGNSEWGGRYDDLRRYSEDLKSRLESQREERKKSEKQLEDSLQAAKSRVELLEGQVKSLTVQKLQQGAPEDDKGSKELVQSLRAQLEELKQRLQTATSVKSSEPHPIGSAALVAAPTKAEKKN